MMAEGRPPRKEVNTYLRYTGLAFQMAGIILVALWLGKSVDAKMSNEKPYMTMLFTLVFFAGFMYKLSRELTKK